METPPSSGKKLMDDPIDKDSIREAYADTWTLPAAPIPRDPDTVFEKFKRSMVMDYDKWHDGVGYEISLLEGATPEDRSAIEALILGRGVQDWRDVEALAAIGTPRAVQVLKECLDLRDSKVAMAVTRYAPELVPERKRIAAIVGAIETADLYSGLSEALGEAADFHPKEVLEALFRGALAGDGGCAVHFAALLMYAHGKADDPFDWNQRPFFLRFNTSSVEERRAVFIELCEKIEVDPSPYLSI